MNEHEKIAKAARQVEAITGFYIHFFIFALVMMSLLIVNALASPELWWVQWPLLGWGVGVAAHALAVFGRLPNVITRWQLRKIKQLKERM